MDDTKRPPAEPPRHFKHGPDGVRTAVEKGERPVSKAERLALLDQILAGLDELFAARVIDRTERDARRRAAKSALKASCLFRCSHCDVIHNGGGCPKCGHDLNHYFDCESPEYDENSAKWDYDPLTYRKLAARLAADLLRVDGPSKSAWIKRAVWVIRTTPSLADILAANASDDAAANEEGEGESEEEAFGPSTAKKHLRLGIRRAPGWVYFITHLSGNRAQLCREERRVFRGSLREVAAPEVLTEISLSPDLSRECFLDEEGDIASVQATDPGNTVGPNARYWILVVAPDPRPIGEERSARLRLLDNAIVMRVGGVPQCDRVIVWRTLGTGDRHGVMGIGQLVNDPELLADGQFFLHVQGDYCPNGPLLVADDRLGLLADFCIGAETPEGVYPARADHYWRLADALGAIQPPEQPGEPEEPEEE